MSQLVKILIAIIVGCATFFMPKLWLFHRAVSNSTCGAGGSDACEVFCPDCSCLNVSSQTLRFTAGLYHSTDFEVHRNWLAITSERSFEWLRRDIRDEGLGTPPPLTLLQSLRYWYREDTSLWTLDYPPLFAWYEWLLANVVLMEPTGRVASWTFGDRDAAMRSVNLTHTRHEWHVMRCTNAPVAVGLGEKRLENSADTEEPLMVPHALHVGRGIVSFMRASVLGGSDIPYFAAACVLIVSQRTRRPVAASAAVLLALLLVAQPAQTLIDNIHFQYNGLIFSVFFVIALFAYDNKAISVVGGFVVLVMLKHMMAYFALGFLVWGLAAVFCGGNCGKPPQCQRSLIAGSIRFVTISIGVVVVLMTLSIGPFIWSEYRHLTAEEASGNEQPIYVNTSSKWTEAVSGALRPMLQRLFPFGRGLTHAYWAPNTWALYSAADLAMCHARRHILRREDIALPFEPFLDFFFPRAAQYCGKTSVNTRGLVGLLEPSCAPDDGLSSVAAQTHAMLPHITPAVTHFLVLGTFVIGIAFAQRRVQARLGGRFSQSLWWWATGDGLMWAASWSAMCFFLLSWHVHEKAVLTISLPLIAASLRYCASKHKERFFVHSSYAAAWVMVGTPAVLPLLFDEAENRIKWAFWMAHVLVLSALLMKCWCPTAPRIWSLFSMRAVVVISALSTLLNLWVDAVHNTTFAPLMGLSCVGAVGVHVLAFAHIRHYLPSLLEFSS